MFGNDIAYTITVNEMNKLYRVTEQSQLTIILWIEGNFKSYFDIQRWLEEHIIDFTIERESWA
jgi:hypothetical protein